MSALFNSSAAECGPVNPLSNLIKQQSGASSSAQQLQQQQQFNQPSASRSALFNGGGPHGQEAMALDMGDRPWDGGKDL
jgi:hypothetical protein